jgi:flavin reductase (DIM6/NTAB) family NADH-FMN oxidoreductase RutF
VKDINFYDHFEEVCKALDSHGAFLAVKDNKGRANIMTIGWVTSGIIWSRPVMTVLVRPTRYTHELMEHASSFSVCVPAGSKLQKELMFCGSRSGRDMDKAKECGVSLVPGRLDDAVIIKECKYIYECEIVHKNLTDSKTLKAEIITDLYPKRDFHTIYFGEIKYSYTI